MNQRLHNLAKWRYVPEGHSLVYPKPKRRTVIVDVNCPDECAFYVVQDREAVEANPEKVVDREAGRDPSPGYSGPEAENDARSVTFLALVRGRDRLEFAVDGSFELMAEGSGGYVYTADSQAISTRIVEPLVFTRIMNRRERNPHLELIEYQMRLNQQRFKQQMEEEMVRRVDEVEARLKAYAPERDRRVPVGKAGVEERRPADVSPVGDDGAADGAAPEAAPPGGKATHKRKTEKSLDE